MDHVRTVHASPALSALGSITEAIASGVVEHFQQDDPANLIQLGDEGYFFQPGDEEEGPVQGSTEQPGVATGEKHSRPTTSGTSGPEKPSKAPRTETEEESGTTPKPQRIPRLPSLTSLKPSESKYRLRHKAGKGFDNLGAHRLSRFISRSLETLPAGPKKAKSDDGSDPFGSSIFTREEGSQAATADDLIMSEPGDIGPDWPAMQFQEPLSPIRGEASSLVQTPRKPSIREEASSLVQTPRKPSRPASELFQQLDSAYVNRMRAEEETQAARLEGFREAEARADAAHGQRMEEMRASEEAQIRRMEEMRAGEEAHIQRVQEMNAAEEAHRRRMEEIRTAEEGHDRRMAELRRLEDTNKRHIDTITRAEEAHSRRTVEEAAVQRAHEARMAEMGDLVRSLRDNMTSEVQSVDEQIANLQRRRQELQDRLGELPNV